MTLTEVDSLEILVLVDNEVDPISKYHNAGLSAYGNLADLATDSPFHPEDRGKCDVREMRMEQICRGGHGLSLLIVSVDF
jgi:7,8-dihydropterin-6-yl-methyl-4-(beta-D-ribofuranosyl)aminobenzene 5'-phosphate synthase